MIKNIYVEVKKCIIQTVLYNVQLKTVNITVITTALQNKLKWTINMALYLIQMMKQFAQLLSLKNSFKDLTYTVRSLNISTSAFLMIFFSSSYFAISDALFIWINLASIKPSFF